MTKDDIATDEATNEVPNNPLSLTDRVLFRPLTFPSLEISTLFLESMFDDLAKAGAAFRRMNERMLAAWVPALDLFKDISQNIERSKRIEASGWLPHYTTPFAAIHDEMTVEEISAVVEQHYRENWHDVERAFLERLAASQLDEEAKATFREALVSHRHGLYRSVPRTLFPEIERVACAKLYDGSRIYRKQDARSGKSVEASITSLPDFATALGELPGDHVLTDYGYALYIKLENHLYKAVKRPDEIAAAVADAVPNRHASLHGIVTYSTMQNSLNSLVMTDFILHLIGQIKMPSSEATREE